MKKLLLGFVALLTAATAVAQNSFSYQAVIRDDGKVLENKTVSLRLSVMQADSVYYKEVHQTTTNAYGNVNINVGEGTGLQGSFTAIPWETMQVMMQVEVSTDGSTYTNMGALQIQPVPYSMYASRTTTVIQPKEASDEPIFQIKDNDGNLLFAVYETGVKVFVDYDDDSKAAKAKFAVASIHRNKGEENLMTVDNQGATIYVDDDSQNSKAAKAKFAVASIRRNKGDENLLTIDNQGATIYVDDDSQNDKAAKAKFAVASIRRNKADENLLTVDDQGATIYVDDDSQDSKAAKAKFAVASIRRNKGEENLMTVDGSGSVIYIDDNQGDKAAKAKFAVASMRRNKGEENLFTIDGDGSTVYVDFNTTDKAAKAKFAVAGRSGKDGDDVLNVDGDQATFYIDLDENENDKAAKSTFAVASVRRGKTEPEPYFIIDRFGSLVYIDDDSENGKAAKAKFAVAGRSGKGTDNFLTVDADSARIYVNDNATGRSNFAIIDALRNLEMMMVNRDSTLINMDSYINVLQTTSGEVLPMYPTNKLAVAMLPSGAGRVTAKYADGTLIEFEQDENGVFVATPRTGRKVTITIEPQAGATDYCTFKKLTIGENTTSSNVYIIDSLRADMDFTAEFELSKTDFTITYNLVKDDVYFDYDGYETYTVDDEFELDESPYSYDGFYFAGWKVAIDGVELEQLQPAIKITEGSIGDRVYTAQWKYAIIAVSKPDWVYNPITDESVKMYYGTATANNITPAKTDDWSDNLYSAAYISGGEKVTLRCTCTDENYVFVGWNEYYDSWFEDIYGTYSNNPLVISSKEENNDRGSRYFVPVFRKITDPIYVDNQYGDDSDPSNLKTIGKALDNILSYEKKANFTIDVSGYDYDTIIDSRLNGKIKSLTLTGSIFNEPSNLTINTTVPIIIGKASSYATTINGNIITGENAQLTLANVIIDSVSLSPTATLTIAGATVTKPIKLAAGQTINITNAGNKAIISLTSCSIGTQVLTSDNQTLLASEASKISIAGAPLPEGYSAEDGWYWYVESDGKLGLTDVHDFELTSSLAFNTGDGETASDALTEGWKYRFVVTDEYYSYSNLGLLFNLLRLENPTSYNDYLYGKTPLGESTIDLSQMTYYGIYDNSSNVAYKDQTSFHNNIVSVTLPKKMQFCQTAGFNMFKDIQGTLREIKIAGGETQVTKYVIGDEMSNIVTGWLDNGALIMKMDNSNLNYCTTYIYCYPGQMEGSTYTIPSDVTGLFDASFYKNKNLIEIKNLNQITKVGGSVFEDAENLKTIDLSNVAEFINRKSQTSQQGAAPRLFKGSKVEKVILPNMNFSIGEEWFNNCTELREVEFRSSTPPTLTSSAAYGTGYNATNSVLAQFVNTHPDLVFRVPSGAVTNYLDATTSNCFAYWNNSSYGSNYRFTNNDFYLTDGNITAVGAARAGKVLADANDQSPTVIIDYYGSYMHYILADSLAQWNDSLTKGGVSRTLDFGRDKLYTAYYNGKEVTSFGNWFKNNQNLSGIVLPQNITAIDVDAFNGCSALASFEVPADVTTIGAGAFSGCSSLNTVSVAENSKLKKIGERVFQNSGLTEITIPASVMRIGANAFSGTNLQTVNDFNIEDWRIWNADESEYSEINLNGQTVAEYMKNSTVELVNKNTLWDESECYQLHKTITLLPETTTGTNGTKSRYVYFGDYPRTHKASDVTVDENKEKTVGAFTYYLGSDKNYYVKHRVVRNSYYYDDGSNVENSGEYAYFKVEPIKWRVLTTDYNGTGKALLMADSATAGYFDYIESGRAFFYYKKNNYDNSYGNRTIDGKTIYPNNYEYSNIRAWLNGYDGSQYDNDLADWTNCGFLQSAFTSSAQNLIVQTTVDNSKEQCFEPDALNIESNTSFDEYLSGNTNDKVFLLSLREVTTHNLGFDDGTVQYGSRVVAPTDYAKASYIYHNYSTNNGITTYYGCEWWLRTPSNNSSSAKVVSNIGYGAGNAEGVEQSMYAVVPAMCVDLSAAGIELTAGDGNPAFENGALTTGKFKVSATGKTVQFSQGNLQYKQNSDFKTYHFADYQYYSIGNYGDKFSADNTSSYNRRDLFLSNRFTSFSDLGIIETNYDDWCELSADEWQYLLSREGKSGVATVDGNNGLILLPDKWTAPEGIAFSTGFVGAEDDYGKNNHYTAAQWVKMEQAGAVFLPAAGSFGWKMNVQNQVLTGYERNVSGLYWSAKDDQDKRKLVWFNKTHFEILESNTLASGDQLNDLAVRLVREVEPESNNGSDEPITINVSAENTFSDAVEQMKSEKAKSYIIIIDGDFSEGDSWDLETDGNMPESILIKGKNNNNEGNKLPKIDIETMAAVTFQNVQIEAMSISGVQYDEDEYYPITVTLDNGAVIQNTNKSLRAVVNTLNGSVTLVMKDGSEIKNCTTPNNYEYGGIILEYATLIMEGGTISGNSPYDVYNWYGTVKIKGNAKAGTVCVYNDDSSAPFASPIIIAGPLSGETPVATIKPTNYNYAKGRSVIVLETDDDDNNISGTTLDAEYNKFVIDNTDYTINEQGIMVEP